MNGLAHTRVILLLVWCLAFVELAVCQNETSNNAVESPLIIDLHDSEMRSWADFFRENDVSNMTKSEIEAVMIQRNLSPNNLRRIVRALERMESLYDGAQTAGRTDGGSEMRSFSSGKDPMFDVIQQGFIWMVQGGKDDMDNGDQGNKPMPGSDGKTTVEQKSTTRRPPGSGVFDNIETLEVGTGDIEDPWLAFQKTTTTTTSKPTTTSSKPTTTTGKPQTTTTTIYQETDTEAPIDDDDQMVWTLPPVTHVPEIHPVTDVPDVEHTLPPLTSASPENPPPTEDGKLPPIDFIEASSDLDEVLNLPLTVENLRELTMHFMAMSEEERITQVIAFEEAHEGVKVVDLIRERVRLTLSRCDKLDYMLFWLVHDSTIYEANAIFTATRDLGTDEGALSDVICSVTDCARMQALKATFQETYHESLFDLLEVETSGSFLTNLKAVIGERHDSCQLLCPPGTGCEFDYTRYSEFITLVRNIENCKLELPILMSCPRLFQQISHVYAQRNMGKTVIRRIEECAKGYSKNLFIKCAQYKERTNLELELTISVMSENISRVQKIVLSRPRTELCAVLNAQNDEVFQKLRSLASKSQSKCDSIIWQALNQYITDELAMCQFVKSC